MRGGNFLDNKDGQVTIFIIMGVLIIGLAVLAYFFLPGIRSNVSIESQTPLAFLQTCLQDKVEEVVETISLRGGNYEPELYFMYEGNPITYLCYTSENFKPCTIQQALLKSHIEKEILSEISNEADYCFNQLEQSYIDRGYNVNLQRGTLKVELLPKRVIVNPSATLILTKGETEEYNAFDIILNNNLYELISITNSIISWESEYGDAETTTYMDYYRDLIVEKHRQIEGTTIYILTDRNTDNKFQFASRSLALTSGHQL